MYTSDTKMSSLYVHEGHFNVHWLHSNVPSKFRPLSVHGDISVGSFEYTCIYSFSIYHCQKECTENIERNRAVISAIYICMFLISKQEVLKGLHVSLFVINIYDT